MHITNATCALFAEKLSELHGYSAFKHFNRRLCEPVCILGVGSDTASHVREGELSTFQADLKKEDICPLPYVPKLSHDGFSDLASHL